MTEEAQLGATQKADVSLMQELQDHQELRRPTMAVVRTPSPTLGPYLFTTPLLLAPH